MDLCHTFRQVSIDSSKAATVVLSTASGTKVQCLNALHGSLSTGGWYHFESLTTGGGDTVTGAMPAAENQTVDWKFEPTVQRCLRSLRGGSLQMVMSFTAFKGYAILSETTHVAT
jgi:hypothetical protein